MPEHQRCQGPMPASHTQPTAGAAGAGADDMHMHVNRRGRCIFFFYKVAIL